MLNIKDIARMAGVSYSTVSKVMNNYPDIGIETRKKVLGVIHETNFSPNSSARNLVQKSSHTIGFIMSGLDTTSPNDTLPTQLLKGALLYIQKTAYDLVFFPTTPLIQQQKSYYQFCKENNIAGALLCGLQTDDRYYGEAKNSDLPCVTIDFSLFGKRNSSVLVNNPEAASCAVEYLIKQNHRQIGIINGKKNSIVGLDRYDGYCQALKNHNIPLNKNYAANGEFSEEIAYQKAKELLIKQPQITALFCASDIMALGVYRVAAELNKTIPDDLSIIGFDDSPLSQYVRPTLTTVRQHFDSIGSKAAALLIKIIESHEKPVQPVYSNYELIVRDSVKKIEFCSNSN